MYQFNQKHFNIDYFLAHIWQQKPAVIKKGFNQFIDPISADELAGLACEEHIESRLIQNTDNKWQLLTGPICEYTQFGESNWTLVVQSVNHWHEGASQLAKSFDFIPLWRLDDVMVSFACQGGGVGPHVDNYDVFICQGSGRRHWKVGDKTPLNEIYSHPKLRHVSEFQPIIDEILECGDILYIPPGFPHSGISLDNSMSFSVGYQALKSIDLFSNFADYLIDNQFSTSLFSDKQRQTQPYEQLSNTDINQLQQLIQQLATDKAKFSNFAGHYFSQSFHELDIVETDYNEADWFAQLQGQSLQKANGIKFLYLESQPNNIYINGECYTFSEIDLARIQVLCSTDIFPLESLTDFLDIDKNRQNLLRITNQGYLFFNNSKN